MAPSDSCLRSRKRRIRLHFSARAQWRSISASVLAVLLAGSGLVLWDSRAPSGSEGFSVPGGTHAGVAVSESRDLSGNSSGPGPGSSSPGAAAPGSRGPAPVSRMAGAEADRDGAARKDGRAVTSLDDEAPRDDQDAAEGDDGPPGLTISGAVMDDRGHLLPAIAVTATPVAGPAPGVSADLVRVTDANGMFTFEALEEGEYDLTAGDGHAHHPARARVRAGVSSAELRLQRLRSVLVEGVVADPQGEPLDDVRVRALGSSAGAATDAMGNYSITVDLVKPGQPPVLAFSRDGYRELRERVESVLESEADLVRHDVRMQPSEFGVSVSGRATGPRGEPVSGAAVWLSSPEPRGFRRTTTGPGGEYLFSEVEIGDFYRSGVEPPEPYAPSVSEAFMVGPDDTIHDIQLEESGEAWLSGEVVDQEGTPLRSFSLWLRNVGSAGGDPLAVHTDGTGYFMAESVPAGSLKIESRSQPHLQATGIELLSGETRHVVVPLDWGPYWLFGQVVDETGSPVARARVVLQWASQYPDVFSASRREASSDRLGYFTFSNLGGSEHVVTVQAAGFDPARMVLDPRSAAEETRISLRRASTGEAGDGSS